MELVNILDVVKIANQNVSKFSGTKRYVATGDVLGNIIYSSMEVTYDSRPSRANIEVKPGQVIFARMQGTTKVLLIDSVNADFIYSTGFCVFEPSKAISSEYLRLILNSDLFQSQKDKYSKGATQKAINNAGLKKIQIPLPSIENQKKIVEVLDKAQGLIDARKEQIRLMDELIQSVFYEMFGDPVTNPKEWETGTINDLTLITQYGTSKKAHETNGEYPVLRMSNITYSGGWDFSSLKYVDLDENELEKYLVYEGELLFNRTNSKELVGKTAVYRESRPIAFAGYLVKLKTNAKGNAEYISAYLNSQHGKANLLNMAKSIVGMANINAEELKKIKINLPSIDIQNEFATIVFKVENEKKKLFESMKDYENNYYSIMQKAFNSKLF